MTKWISIERAALKHGINKEVLLLWGKKNYLTLEQVKDEVLVDEECIDEFIRRDEERMKRELIDTLEELCIAKTQICQRKNEMLGIKDEIIQLMSREIQKLKEIQKSIDIQEDRLRDFTKEFAEYESYHIKTSRISKLRMKVKRIIYRIFKSPPTRS